MGEYTHQSHYIGVWVAFHKLHYVPILHPRGYEYPRYQHPGLSVFVFLVYIAQQLEDIRMG